MIQIANITITLFGHTADEHYLANKKLISKTDWLDELVRATYIMVQQHQILIWHYLQ
jgi:hypothetical protein